MELHTRRTLAAFMLLVALPAQAGINRWTPVGPGGGTVLELAFDPETPGTVYALVAGGGVFKSTNGGETWAWVSSGLLGRSIHALVLDPRHPDTLFVGMLDNEGGVYRSTNGGLTWARVLDHGAVDALAVAPGEPSTAFAALGNQVYRSPDGGTTWQLVLQTGLAFRDIEVDPSDPKTVYASGHGGVWKSVDGGVTWQPSDRVVGTEGIDRLTGVFDLAVAPSNPQRLYAVANLSQLARSDDGGATWEIFVPFNFDARVVTVDPASADTVYTGGIERVLVSRDAGESFEWLRNGYPKIGDLENTTPDAWDVEIDPHDPDRIYAGVGYLGMLIYEDDQWHQPPLTGMTKNSVRLLGVRPDGTLYARFFDDVDAPTLFSRNGGRTWSPLAPDNFGNLKVRAMAFDPRQPHVAWLTLGNQIFRIGPDGAEATVWTPHSPMFDRSPINAFAVLGSQEVVAGSCGIWRTLDRGRTWRETLRCDPGGPDDNQIRRVTRMAVDPFNPNILLAGSQIFDLGDGSLPPRQIALHIHISQDRGASWRRLVNGTDLFAFDPGRRGSIYAPIGDSVLRSANYGRTWVRGAFTTSRIMELAVDPFSPGTLYAATRELGIFRSRNGGATWTTVNAGLARPGRLEISQILADPASAHRFFVTPFEGGLFTARFSD